MDDLLQRLDDAANDTHYIDHITAREAAARIRELEARLAAPVSVKVKPLVWREDGPEWPNCFHAVTNVGRYEIGPYNKGTFSCHVDPQMRDIGLSFLSPDEAKAAAQADYHARILAAVEAVPVAEVWRRAIEAAAMVAGVGTFPITGRYDDLTPAAQARANECACIQNAIRAMSLPDDLK